MESNYKKKDSPKRHQLKRPLYYIIQQEIKNMTNVMDVDD